MKRIPALFIIIIPLSLMIACQTESSEETVTAVSDDNEIVGVSVWDRISTRSKPVRNSPSNTLMSLGESFIYLDSTAIDSSYNNTRFLKARLSDTSIVWVYDFASVLNAKPAVITNEVPLYMRPDLLTISDKKINTMEIVAVIEEWDNWIKVVGEKKEKVGWIKKEFITENGIDLAFSLLAKRKLEEKDTEQKIKALEDLLENNPYPNTVFTAELRKIIDREKEILRESREDQDREDENRRRRD